MLGSMQRGSCPRSKPLLAVLPPVLIFLSLLPPAALGIENKCSACVAVQHELMDILLQERPQGVLDMRNRLNSQGKREGKVIDYKDSELRIIQILEGLCEKVKKYSVMPSAKDKKRIWMRGQSHASDRLRLIAEEQGKELKRWCDRMLEEFEDDMTSMIREEAKTSYKDVPIILCRNITSSCKDEEAYSVETARMEAHWPSKQGSQSSGGPKVEVTVGDPEKKQDESSEEEKKLQDGPAEETKTEL